MIDRRVTRVLLNTTEVTQTLQDASGNDLTFELETTDDLFIGFYGQFASRHFTLPTPNTTPSVITIQYFNGSVFTDVLDTVDQTQGFTQSGFISWNNVGDWKVMKQTPVDDTDLYWIKLTVSADLSVGTELRSLINIFADDNDLRVYYPDLVTDTSFLPSGRTDFLEQHIAAKNMTVLRLKQRKVIVSESQIIDINPVSPAAVHQAAFLILNPIARSDQEILAAARAQASFENEIRELKKEADLSGDGIVSDGERSDSLSQPFITRR